jgi:hypothetical protein
MSQNGFTHLSLIIITLLLLAGVGIGIYLVQNPAIFKPKADSQADFYVAPNGSDSNNGSINSPFQTIDKARQAVRTVNRSMSGRINVYLRQGVYLLSAPIEFSPEDSGFNGNYVVYQPYQSEKAVISGGRQITGWVQEGDKWKAPAAGINTRQLYVNGNRGIRARSDDGVETRIVCANPDPTQSQTCTGFQTANMTLQNYRNKTDLELVSNNNWRHFRCPIASISGGNITLKQPCFDTAKYQYPAIKDPDYFENALELLNNPGEWYLDKSTQTIYYKPRPGENMANAYVVAPVLDKLIVGRGTPDNQVHNIAFENLRFEYTTWNAITPGGFVGTQASGYWPTTVGSNGKVQPAISFEGAKNIDFSGNLFQHLGGLGLFYDYASQDNVINANRFTNLSGGGILVGENKSELANQNLPDNKKTARNKITNNFIHDTGIEFPGSVGIDVLFATDTIVSQNELAHLPYTGISMTSGWTFSRNNVITHNLIYDHMKTMNDGGGIYVNNSQPGTAINENVIHTQWNRPGNIYLDDGSTGYNVLFNVIYDIRAPNPDARTFYAKGCNHSVHNNYWVVPTPQDVLFENKDGAGVPCSNDSSNNVQITDPSQAPQNVINNAGIEAAHQGVKNIDLSPVIPTTPPPPPPTQPPTSPPASSPPTPPPSAPVPATFTLNQPTTFCSGSNSHIRLSWTAPSTNPPRPGVNSGYFIYINGVYKYNALHVLTFDDPEPKAPGQTYTYKIDAVVVPDKASSNEVNVVAATCAPPASPGPSLPPLPPPPEPDLAAPINLSIPGLTTVPPGPVPLTWERAPGHVDFTVKIDDLANDYNNCDGPDRSGDVCLQHYTGGGVYTHNFIKDHNYNIQVFQQNAAGQDVGGTVGVSVTAQAPGPFTLAANTYCSVGNSHIRLGWSKPTTGPRPGIDSGYFVYVNGQYTYNALHVFRFDDPTPRVPGQTYKYKIEAVVNAGAGGKTFSNEIDVVAENCNPPGSFTLNPPVAYCEGTNSLIQLSWTASPNGPRPGTNSGYFVYIDGEYKYNALDALTLADPAVKTAGQTYKYKIESVVIPNGRTFSNEHTIVAANCATPVPKQGDIDKDGDVDLYDLNLLLTDFPTRALRSDVDGDGDLDIFDLNFLLINFGK